ncbi:MAG TPA: KOW motif-containing protein, partial [Candidatus Nanopelagicales bacterium]|nr:KOW motif-containing protein [Candidatus Nanopelagicales bacterium]
ASGSGPLDKGARVRVLRGPFEGKLGVIGELDGRGGARVLLGLLSTRLELSELEPASEPRERPALGTSHRKPQASAQRKAR